MSALGHYLEREGLPTVSISLIREHTEGMRAPRALWVPFELGRPLGPPGEPLFQRRVLTAGLALLSATEGPVLEDFPEDAPSGSAGAGAVWACPVSFPRPAGAAPSLAEAVAAEVRSLEPWYELGRERRGRTTVGLSGLGVEAIVNRLVGYAERDEAALDEPSVEPEVQLKLALDDLLAFYQEAAASQPGPRPASREVLAWFWTETAAGRLFDAVRERGRSGANEQLRFIVERLLVPREAQALLAERAAAAD